MEMPQGCFCSLCATINDFLDKASNNGVFFCRSGEMG